MLFELLNTQMPWREQAIQMFGRQVMQPRLIAWFADRAYRYSGLTLAPTPWPPVLASLRDQVSEVAGQAFRFS